MILTPDYFVHWKIQQMVALTSDPNASIYPIRLYLFCDQRKDWIHQGMTQEKLKAIVKWDGDAEQLWHIFLDCMIFEVDGDYIIVQSFYDANSKMCANWKNGLKEKKQFKARRSQQEAKQSQDEANDKPPEANDKPKVSQAEAKISKEENRRKGKKKVPKKSATATLIECFAEFLNDERFMPLNVELFNVAYKSFLENRVELKKSVSKRSIELHLLDAVKVGPLVAAEMMNDAVKGGWTGWYFKDKVEEYKATVASKKGHRHSALDQMEGSP